ncbi:MAG: HAD family hydrolase [Clostridia bacterium]|nr:HAD family hydrolase [Clostridia bacterium]
MQTVKWLFFDIGSTLVDETAAYEHRMREMAEAAHTTYDHVCETALGFYKQNKKGDKATADLLGIEMPRWHKEDERLYGDAAECLKTLSKRYKLGVIANQSPGTASRLERWGILQYVDLVIASAEEGVSKPDPRIFRLALERSGCSAEQAVMIGDRVDNDIVPAKAMGMHTVWIKQGWGKYWNVTRKTERAEYTVDNLLQICDIL